MSVNLYEVALGQIGSGLVFLTSLPAGITK